MSASLWLIQQTDKGAGRSSWGVFLTHCLMSLETVNVPQDYCNMGPVELIFHNRILVEYGDVI